MRRAPTIALLLAVELSACARFRLQSPIAPAAGPPVTFVRTTSDVRTTRVIDLRDGLTKTAAFRAATDFLTQQYTVDVSDPRAGFLMTPWQGGTDREGVPDFNYRTRIVVRFLGDDWKQVAVRAEANWRRDDEWDVGYDAKMLDEVVTELKTRLARR